MTVQRVYVANDTLLSSFSHLLPTIKTNLRVAGTQSSQSLVSGANLDFKLETRVHVVAIISLNDFNLSAPSVCTRRRLGTELEAWRGGGRERKSHSRGLIASLWHRHADGLEASHREVREGISRGRFWNSCVHSSRMVLPRVRCLAETLQSHPCLSTTPNSWRYPLPSVFPLLFQTRVNFNVGGILVVPVFLINFFCSAPWEWCQPLCWSFSKERRLQSSWQFLHWKMPTHHII